MTTFNTNISTVFGTPTAGHINIWNRLRQMAALRKQRLALSRMTSDQLSDIGVTADQAQEEAQRPVWDVPQNWKY